MPNPAASPVIQFLEARDKLMARRQALERELTEIKAALEPSALASEVVNPTAEYAPLANRASRTVLTSALTAILKDGPHTKKQIIERLRVDGLLAGDSPRIALDPIIYSKRFRRVGKLFSLAEAPAG